MLAPAVVCWIALHSSAWFGGRVVPLPAPLDVLITFAISFASYLVLNTEEVAWRGYALPQLLTRASRWRASLLLGLVWGLFHLPLFLLKGGHPAGYPFPLYLVFSLALAVVFTWLMEHTAGSLLLAHLFHQAINGWAEALPFYPRSTGSLAPFLLVVAVLAAGALLIGWRWSRADPLRSNEPRSCVVAGRRAAAYLLRARRRPKRIRRTPSDPKSITPDVPIWFGIATPSPPCSCWCWGSLRLLRRRRPNVRRRRCLLDRPGTLHVPSGAARGRAAAAGTLRPGERLRAAVARRDCQPGTGRDAGAAAHAAGLGQWPEHAYTTEYQCHGGAAYSDQRCYLRGPSGEVIWFGPTGWGRWP